MDNEQEQQERRVKDRRAEDQKSAEIRQQQRKYQNPAKLGEDLGRQRKRYVEESQKIAKRQKSNKNYENSKEHFNDLKKNNIFKDEYIRLKELSKTYSKIDQKIIESAENKYVFKNKLPMSDLPMSGYRAEIELIKDTQQKRSNSGNSGNSDESEAMKACRERNAAFSKVYNARSDAQIQSRTKGRSR